MTLASAIQRGLHRSLSENDRVLVMGEDVGKLGGVFRVTDGLLDEFGPDRVVDTPLSEAGIVGTAIGLALHGFRPVCEIQFDGFVYPAMNQIMTQLARIRYRTRGLMSVPVVIRIPYGGGIGAIEHHSESVESYFVHTMGLRVATPSTPQDAHDITLAAVQSDDPVILLEPKRRYWERGEVNEDTPHLDALGTSQTLRHGDHVTLVTYGPCVRVCLDTADAAAEEGVQAEVIDLRSLAPLDLAPVVASAQRTGHVIVVHEAPRTLGVGSEIAARITEESFYSLEAPVTRVTGWDTPYPPAMLEEHYLPNTPRILEAIHTVLAY